MARPELCALAAELEEYLGDPADPESRMPFAGILDLDEREEYPHAFVSELEHWGLHEFVIPAAQGGKAIDVEDGFNLLRLVARRDPTTATAMMLTSLSFMPVWIAGTDEQRQYFADGLKEGMKLAWGLSERAHGSDILANEMVAEKVEGGYLLTGEKWTIGNATVADAVMVFARTRAQGGPGGYSIFALEKDRVRGSFEELPDEHILGLRGLDMSGIRVDGCFVPDSALVGHEGQGLEIALKASQLARTTINSMALGCVDTALRVTLDFATTREIFSQRVADIPYSRRQLVDCFADLLIADALAIGAVRSLQVAPAQSSIWSSTVKYLVPTILEESVGRLAVVLGARHYLRTHPRYGVFQKMMRDLRVANFADGNTVVNLKNIVLQLESLLGAAIDSPPAARAAAVERVRVVFGLDAELPPYRPSAQELFGRGGEDCLVALPDSIARLRAIAASAGGAEAERLERAAALAAALAGEARRMRSELEQLEASLGRGFAHSPELFDLAKQYCALQAAAACVHVNVHSRDGLVDPFPSGALLLVCLERIWHRFRPVERVADEACVDAAAAALEQLHRERRLFSFFPFALAVPAGAAPGLR